MAEQRPFSINTFVPDGDLGGLRIVETSNWTGEGVVFNRTSYKAVAGRRTLLAMNDPCMNSH